MTDRAIPVKYVLYTHYWQTEREDMKEHFTNHVKVERLPGLNQLVSYFPGLRQLLTASGHEGILVLFYTPGYAWFLDALTRSDLEKRLAESTDEAAKALRFARAAGNYIRRRAAEHGLAERIRFITPLDLDPILGGANTVFAASFSKYFTGGADGIRYDAPKVVEAILRLRLVGTGVPVLRVDQDALFDKLKKDVSDLGMFRPVACAVRAYRLRIEQPAISTFVFSASYDSSAVAERPNEFEPWSRAFATRIFPALVAEPRAIDGDTDWDDYVERHLDQRLACRFYGLKPVRGRLESDGTKGLISIGAHPLYSVISGALLCLSDGAIIDLPPFSNFRDNVMWIDDFLKYSLHRAMNHFASGETLGAEPSLANARLDDVTVTKARPGVPNIPSYVFGQYLPTLLLGTIMDAWITIDPILKCRSPLLGPEDRELWRNAQTTQDSAPLPQAMIKALHVGTFGGNEKTQLEQLLARTAAQRIEQVRQEWAALRTNSKRSFVSYWAAGDVRQHFGAMEEEPGLWEGIAPGRPLNRPIKDINELSSKMLRKVTDLIADTVEYVEWTLAWPKFVQMVRSARQGDFAGDLSWRPAPPAPKATIPIRPRRRAPVAATA
jgi:hypothetical protein